MVKLLLLRRLVAIEMSPYFETVQVKLDYRRRIYALSSIIQDILRVVVWWVWVSELK
jgi:hypothetical protein